MEVWKQSCRASHYDRKGRTCLSLHGTPLITVKLTVAVYQLIVLQSILHTTLRTTYWIYLADLLCRIYCPRTSLLACLKIVFNRINFHWIRKAIWKGNTAHLEGDQSLPCNLDSHFLSNKVNLDFFSARFVNEDKEGTWYSLFEWTSLSSFACFR